MLVYMQLLWLLKSCAVVRENIWTDSEMPAVRPGNQSVSVGLQSAAYIDR